MSGSLDPWEIRIKAAQESLQRSRYAFLAATVISIAFAILCYNETLSWDRMYLNDNTTQVCDEIEKAISKKGDQSDADAFMKSWLENMVMSNSLLGIRIASSDVYLLGGPVIIVLLVLSFYAVRRENHLIADLVVDVFNADDPPNSTLLKESVFRGVASYTVFITLTDEHRARLVVKNTGEEEKNTKYKYDLLGPPKIDKLVKLGLEGVSYSPFLALCWSFVLQWMTLMAPSPARCGQREQILLLTLGESQQEWVFYSTPIMVICIISSLILCSQLHKFQSTTKDNLNLLQKDLYGDKLRS